MNRVARVRRHTPPRHVAGALPLAAVLVLAGCGEGEGRGARGAEAEAVPRPAAVRVEGRPHPSPSTSRGLDSLRLAAAYARAAELPRLRSLLVARHGDLVGERYFHGARPDGLANVKSASKSLLSALVGIAIAEGHLAGVEHPIAGFFPRELGGEDGARKREITVGDLLSMRSGLQPTSFGNYGAWVDSPDWVRYVLSRPLVDVPGGRMLYSTGSTHLLSAILTRATGSTTLEYARSRLAEPLGIDLRPWPRDPQGVYFGGNDMRMRPRDLLRFGELYRNGGMWEGRRVVPEAWVRESWTPRTASPYNGHRYGYGWWIRESGGYRVNFAWGYGGQFVFVVPELELTVVTTSEPDSPRSGEHLREVHALLDRWIVPAAAAGGAVSSGAAQRPGVSVIQ